MGASRVRIGDKLGNRGLQRAESREADRLVIPQAEIVKLGNVGQGVVATGVGVAGEVADLRQPTKHAHARAGIQGFEENVQVHHQTFPEELLQSMNGCVFGEHLNSRYKGYYEPFSCYSLYHRCSQTPP